MRDGRRLWFLILVGIGGVAVLAGLGAWQVQRLAWKNGLIAELERRLAEAPLTLDGSERMESHNFRRARATGRFAPGDPVGRSPARFLTSERPDGPGFRLIEPFALESGRRILVDRGYVPDAVTPPPAPEGRVGIVGALHWPREVGGFTPDPAVEAGRWFARDVPALAAALGAEPVMLVLSERPVSFADGRAPSGDWPRPTPVTVDLPNDHLGYAITWFGLAAVWVVMSATLLLRGWSLERQG